MRHTILSLRRHARQVGDIVVVSAAFPRPPTPAELGDGDATWFDEARFPFSLGDFEGCEPSPGWVLQQLLKLYAPQVLAAAEPPVITKTFPLPQTASGSSSSKTQLFIVARWSRMAYSLFRHPPTPSIRSKRTPWKTGP